MRLVSALLTFFLSSVVIAQGFPSQPVRLVSPFPPGSPSWIR